MGLRDACWPAPSLPGLFTLNGKCELILKAAKCVVFIYNGLPIVLISSPPVLNVNAFM